MLCTALHTRCWTYTIMSPKKSMTALASFVEDSITAALANEDA